MQTKSKKKIKEMEKQKKKDQKLSIFHGLKRNRESKKDITLF